jgi:hypothetical protein
MPCLPHLTFVLVVKDLRQIFLTTKTMELAGVLTSSSNDKRGLLVFIVEKIRCRGWEKVKNSLMGTERVLSE